MRVRQQTASGRRRNSPRSETAAARGRRAPTGSRARLGFVGLGASLLVWACLPSADLSGHSRGDGDGLLESSERSDEDDGLSDLRGASGGADVRSAADAGDPGVEPAGTGGSSPGGGGSGGSGSGGSGLDAGASQPPIDSGAGGSGAGGSGAGGSGGSGTTDAGDPPPACEPGATLGENGRCYFFSTALQNWADARAACRALGAGWDLATVLSDADSGFLAEQVAIESWVGASDAAEEGVWIWVSTGQNFYAGDGSSGGAVDNAYANWNSNEPNGGTGSNCARVLPRTDSFPSRNAPWADLSCAELRGAVCEGPTD